MKISKESSREVVGISEKTPQWVAVLHEVERLPSKEEKVALLTHQLNAIMKEHFGLPFHSYAMVSHTGFHELHDTLYFSSNVLDRCKNAIDSARDAVHKVRYTRERKQVEKLLAILQHDSSKFAHTALDLLAHDTSNKKNQPKEWSQAFGLLSSDVCWQLKIAPDTPHFVGKKYFSIMPQSSVHEGWKSMYVICQPAYLPEYNLWIVLQDQHMLDATWQQHHARVSDLNPQYIPASQKDTPDDQEAQIMDQYIELDSKYTLVPARDAFIQLLYKRCSDILAEQESTLAQFNRIAESFPIHIRYLLDTLDLDKKISNEREWSRQKSERVFQAMEKTIHTLLLNRSITHVQTNSWLKEYEEIFSTKKAQSNPWRVRSAHQLLAIKSANWLSMPVVSQLECFTGSFGVLSKLGMHSESLTSAIQAHKLTPSQLEQLIGSDRMKNWRPGICRVCRVKDLVGECNVCKNCENILNNETMSQSAINDHSPVPLGKKNLLIETKDLSSLTVTQFIVGDIPAYST